MCRIFLATKSYVQRVGRVYLNELFTEFEQIQGGHGNGYALIGKEEVTGNKSMDMSMKDIVNVLMREEYDYCIVHTRLTSCGEISDENCQPFIGQSYVLAHNGHIPLLSKGSNRSDTACLHELLENGYLGLESLVEVPWYTLGAYMAVNNTWLPFVACEGGNFKLMVSYNEGGNDCFAFANGFLPHEDQSFELYSLTQGTLWVPGT